MLTLPATVLMRPGLVWRPTAAAAEEGGQDAVAAASGLVAGGRVQHAGALGVRCSRGRVGVYVWEGGVGCLGLPVSVLEAVLGGGKRGEMPDLDGIRQVPLISLTPMHIHPYPIYMKPTQIAGSPPPSLPSSFPPPTPGPWV